MGDRIAMVIVVECASCHSRFRVKKSLLDGAFAIRFRCRSCDGYIVVRNPEMRKIAPIPSPAPPPPPVSSEDPAAHPGPEMETAATSAPPDSYIEPEMPVRGDTPALSDPYIEPEMPGVASNPVPAAAGGEPEASAVGNESVFPDEAGSGVPRLEDLVPFVPEGEVRSSRDTVGVAGAVKRAGEKKRSTALRIHAWATGVFAFFAGLGILLLLATGAHYIWGTFDPWVKSPAKEATIPRTSNAASAPAKPVFDVQNLDAYIPRNAIAGNLFVITGTVKNVGNASSRWIHIQATLFGKDNQVLIKQESIAGNHIDKFALPLMNRASIEGLLASRDEAGAGNHALPPGNSLPFIVVCFDPPGKVESFKVFATNAEP